MVWRLCTGTKGDQAIDFRISSGTMSPRKRRKKSKKVFFEYLYWPKRPKKF
jgi:hypothetical protein